jgi:putative transcriptional regulator
LAGTRSPTRRQKTRASKKTDWAEVDAMTEDDVVARAMTDPDNRPLTDEDYRRMKRTPRVTIIRRAFRMTQEEFAEAFRIPIGTLRDWEQGRTEPDQANQAYLKVIAVAPHTVRKALAHKPGEPTIEKMEFKG